MAIIYWDFHDSFADSRSAKQQILRRIHQRFRRPPTADEIKQAKHLAYADRRYVCSHVREVPGAKEIAAKLCQQGHLVTIISRSGYEANAAIAEWIRRQSELKNLDLPLFTVGRTRRKAALLRTQGMADLLLENDPKEAEALKPFVETVCLLTDPENINYDTEAHGMIRVASPYEFYDVAQVVTADQKSKIA